jgi:2-amino-4-hydroxy-6-hydroxymethyldihydropteridine diphosphokinase
VTPAIRAFVGIGANLGDVRAAFHSAFAAISTLPGTEVLRTSSLYVSAPHDACGPDYLNAVADLSTTLTAHELLARLQSIERQAGRQRPYRNAPRTLDLDLLLYGKQRIASAALIVPHPRLHERAFVLRPLAEIEPELVIPGFGPVAGLLPNVADQRVAKLPPC